MMKPVTVLFFIVLYTAFAQFAVAGFAASECCYNTNSIAASHSEDTGIISTDNQSKDCNHKPAVTAHVIHKQITNVGGGNKKYVSVNKQLLYPYSKSGVQLLHNSTLYVHVTLSNPYPLFIKYCVFLI
jgi:hypothetical protein